MNDQFADLIYREAKRVGLPGLIAEIRTYVLVRSLKEFKATTIAAEKVGMKRTAMIMARRRLGLK